MIDVAMTFEDNMEDIIADMEDIEPIVVKKDRKTVGLIKLIESPANIEVPVAAGGKKKRKPTEYNLYLGKCMREGGSMKDCAAEYQVAKNSGDHIYKKDESNTTTSKNENKIKDGQAFLVTTKYCPACEDLKSKKYVKNEIKNGHLVVVGDGDKLKDEIERAVHITAYPEFAVYFEDEGFVDSNTATE